MDWEFGLIAPLAFRMAPKTMPIGPIARRTPAARLAPPGGSAATRCEGRRFRLPTSHRRSGRPDQNNSSLSQGLSGSLVGPLGSVSIWIASMGTQIILGWGAPGGLALT